MFIYACISDLENVNTCQFKATPIHPPNHINIKLPFWNFAVNAILVMTMLMIVVHHASSSLPFPSSL